MAYQSLDIHKLIKSKNLQTIITFPGDSIECFLVGDFSFSLGNNWQPIMPMDSVPFMSELNDIAAYGAATIGAPQGTMENFMMTSASWRGSNMPAFGLDLLFVAYQPNENPIDKLLMLASGALPSSNYDLSKTGISGIDNTVKSVKNIAKNIDDLTGFIQKQGEDAGIFETIVNTVTTSGQKAPLGYGIKYGQNKEGDAATLSPIPNTTISFNIGNWFRCHEMIIKDISNISISKEVTLGGQPLYITCYVEFRPYKMIDYKEFKDYFLIRNPDNILQKAVSSVKSKIVR